MDITLSSGETLTLTWRADGVLFVAIVGESAGKWDDTAAQYPVRASATLRGEALLTFLEGFVSPILRRALATLVGENPRETARHNK
jgi:hypothetical protein